MTYGVATGRGHSWTRPRRHCWRKRVRALPNKGLKLAGVTALREPDCSCPGGHELSSITLRRRVSRPQLKRDPLGRCRSSGGVLKYLRQDREGAWQWEPYRDYLAQIRDRLPPQVAAFATHITRYSLDSPESLHDAWLESLEILEPAEGKRHEQRAIRITVRLLGAFHDRIHELTYVAVRRYRIDAPAGQRGHGDLIVHEVRIEEDDLIVHELLFANGGTVEIGCADLFYTERLLGTGTSGPTSA